MLGIAIAVAVLIVVLSVVNGFERELKDRLLAMSAHASITGPDGKLPEWQSWVSQAEQHGEVSAAAPFVDGQGLLLFGERLSGAEFRGVDPTMERRVSGIDDIMIDGELDSLQSGEFNIVLGVELANVLQVEMGDKITLTLAQGMVTPAGVVPRIKRFTVSGTYRVGMYEFDRRLAFINLTDAQKLFRLHHYLRLD